MLVPQIGAVVITCECIVLANYNKIKLLQAKGAPILFNGPIFAIYIFQVVCHAINVLKLMFFSMYLNIRPYALHANNSRQKF